MDGGFWATWLGQFFLVAAENLIKMLPYIEGFGCMIAYSLRFPYVNYMFSLAKGRPFGRVFHNTFGF